MGGRHRRCRNLFPAAVAAPLHDDQVDDDDDDDDDCIAFSTGHYGARKVGRKRSEEEKCMHGVEADDGGGGLDGRRVEGPKDRRRRWKALLAFIICGKHPAAGKRAGGGARLG